MWFGLVQNKWTPLHKAAVYGHNESMQLLLTAKGNANAENNVSDSLPQIWWNFVVVLSCVVWIGAGQANPATVCSTQRALRLYQAVETSLWLRNSITSPLHEFLGALDEFRSMAGQTAP